jgi:transcriptional regulator with XRE-family HTH domain
MQEYAVICSLMQEGEQLRAFMQKRRLNQPQLAAAANVSQSTVSRTLRGAAKRYSKARLRLLAYAGITESAAEIPGGSATERVVNAFKRIWDGTEVHAAKIVEVIDALSGLHPNAKDEKGEKT